MGNRLFAALALPALAACGWAVQDPSIFISAPDLSFVLKGFSEARSAKVEQDSLNFSGSGNPVIAEMNSLGVTLQGRTIEGKAKRAQAATYFLEEATVTGTALAVISTDIRESWEIGAKKRTEKSPEQSVTRISGEKIAYVGGATEGTATIPAATTIKSVTRGTQTIQREGKPVAQRFEQTVDITSANSSLTIDPSAKGGRNQVKRGVFEGPVSITVVRNVRDEGAEAAESTTYTAKGNRLVADFTGTDRTIALTGNVTISGTGSFVGNATANAVTIFVDEDMKPIRYDFSGTPTETRIKTGGGK